MNRKGAMSVGMIVILIILIIVALVLIQEIFNQQTVMTTKTSIGSEAIDISSARYTGNDSILTNVSFTIANAYDVTDWQYGDSNCLFSNVEYGNSSLNFTADTDYSFNTTTGIFYLRNTSNVNGVTGTSSNDTLIHYTFCQDGYITGSGGRSTAALIGLLTVVALFAVVIWKSDVISDWV